MIRDAFNNRSEGDYGAFITFAKDDVMKSFEDMKEFIQVIEEHIDKAIISENRD